MICFTYLTRQARFYGLAFLLCFLLELLLGFQNSPFGEEKEERKGGKTDFRIRSLFVSEGGNRAVLCLRDVPRAVDVRVTVTAVADVAREVVCVYVAQIV